MKNFTKRVKALDANIKVPKGTPKLASMRPFLHGGTSAPMHLTEHCAHPQDLEAEVGHNHGHMQHKELALI